MHFVSLTRFQTIFCVVLSRASSHILSLPAHGPIHPSPANLHAPLDWLDVARQCRMPIQPLHASPRVAAPDREASDSMELLSGRLHDAPHHLPWNHRRSLEERQPTPTGGPMRPCPFATSYPSDHDDDMLNGTLNFSTSVHCSHAGLTGLPQPLRSDALYLSVR
jgi:hypothetical protein